jgi:predicted outer membrane lipoprotein
MPISDTETDSDKQSVSERDGDLNIPSLLACAFARLTILFSDKVDNRYIETGTSSALISS